jgi:tetratricopeptide (TPR) repeat protein
MSRLYRRLALPSLALVFAWPGSVASQRHDHDHAGASAPARSLPLREDLGSHHRAIATESELAQSYFDQGLRLQYAFNHADAIRSYEEALRHDPRCAMCWWGIALASGQNINAPATDADARRAYRASVEAVRLLREDSTESERALISALAERYGPEPDVDRASLDSAYARAMARAARAHPGDADVLTLYGAALMNLSPWNYWDGTWEHRTPRDGTLQILDVLQTALGIDRENPGACHYFIHLVEAARPEQAVGCADRLAALMPGAGHIVHMPGHIYIRVGRYADAVRQNEHAVHADETLMMDMGSMKSLYTGAYYPHNFHFLAFAATMAGMSERALEASRAVAPKVPLDVARDVYWIQNAVVLPQLTLLTFGRWNEVLAEPTPPAELEQASILADYARGTALAALGRDADARRILGNLTERARIIGGDPAMNPIPHISPLVLAGEIALRTGKPAEAAGHFRAAVAIEDALLYDEPPLWYYPIRQSLGRALLEAGDPEEAESAYRADLAKFPENGWSLLGLALSLEAQGKVVEAEAARVRFERAWASADVPLKMSRF